MRLERDYAILENGTKCGDVVDRGLMRKSTCRPEAKAAGCDAACVQELGVHDEDNLYIRHGLFDDDPSIGDPFDGAFARPSCAAP